METAQAVNPIKSLLNFGQSVWLDYIRRNMLTNGELSKFIKEDGLRGMTSNPAIFQKAIGTSSDYDQAIQALTKDKLETVALYEKLAIEDVQMATDLFKPLYEQTNKLDGYVSLEVSPYLAEQSEATIAEAKRLWKAVNRPNVMIKVPGTTQGLIALEELIAEGINVNVTLLFSRHRYEEVAKTYIKGLERFSKKGGDISKVASVASFFISRIDSNVDKAINEKIKSAKDDKSRQSLSNLLGKIAIANAKLAYQIYKEIISSPQWKELAKKGAMPQRLLWASTSTKNPQYRDVYYVEELIGQDTVNTIPPATYSAFKDHGHIAKTLDADLEKAKATIQELEQFGINLEEICNELIKEGIKLFCDPFDSLIATLKEEYARFSNPEQGNKGDDSKKKHLDDTYKEWQQDNKVKKLWAADSSLWTDKDESKWLGWLNIVDQQLAEFDKFDQLKQDVLDAKFKHVLLIGMGGSSLGPAVLASALGQTIKGFPQFHLIDSTVPDQIATVEKSLDLAQTLFIVSSKSGSTLEPNILKDYFFEKAKAVLGADKVGKHFIAITDPGSHMEQLAKSEGFRKIFYGLPSIGGRYSVLSDFGMIPATVTGIDIKRLLNKAKEMKEACKENNVEKNEAVKLGISLGLSANKLKDKITLIVSPAIIEMGAWLEQLFAESTGKTGKGLIPVDKEDIGDTKVYGFDRYFIYLSLKGKTDPVQDNKVMALEKAGFQVSRIELDDIYDLAREFFRFEFATAVAGSVMDINPFDQPDVEAAKVKTRAITDDYEKTGQFRSDAPVWSSTNGQASFYLYADHDNWKRITDQKSSPQTLDEVLGAFLNDIASGNYFAILAFIEMNATHAKLLHECRMPIRDQFQVATCLGFGPRYLHSTGQVYKGGPNSGHFIVLSSDSTAVLTVPGKNYDFELVKNAQALGDYQVLSERQRKVIRLHIKGKLETGLSILQETIHKIVG